MGSIVPATCELLDEHSKRAEMLAAWDSLRAKAGNGSWVSRSYSNPLVFQENQFPRLASGLNGVAPSLAESSTTASGQTSMTSSPAVWARVERPASASASQPLARPANGRERFPPLPPSNAHTGSLALKPAKGSTPWTNSSRSPASTRSSNADPIQSGGRPSVSPEPSSSSPAVINASPAVDDFPNLPSSTAATERAIRLKKALGTSGTSAAGGNPWGASTSVSARSTNNIAQARGTENSKGKQKHVVLHLSSR